MRIKLVIVFFSFSAFSFGQDAFDRSHQGLYIFLGQKVYKNDFNKKLASFQDFKPAQSPLLIGFGWSGPHVADGSFYYTQMIPSKIRINDTITSYLTGRNINVLWGWDFMNKKSVDLVMSGGFNAGRLILFNNKTVNSKNPFFAPKISLTTRIKIRKISVSIRIEYDYDISNSKWKKIYVAKAPSVYVNGFNQSGLTIYLCIGKAK